MRRKSILNELTTEELILVTAMLGLTGFISYSVGHGKGVVDSINYMIKHGLVKPDVTYQGLVRSLILG